MSEVFISYSSKDRDNALTIVRALEGAGLRCWIDQKIVPGMNWNDEISAALETAAAVVLLCSQASLRSTRVEDEIEKARRKNVPVLPIRLDDTPISGGMEMLIQRYQWLDAYRESLPLYLDSIVSSVRTLVQRTPVSIAKPAPAPAAMPQRVASRDSVRIRIPGGELGRDGETIGIQLVARGDGVSRLKATAARMQSTGRGMFLVPEVAGSSSGRVEFRAEVDAALKPFLAVAAEWRENLVLNLPSILRFGEAVAAWCRFMEESGAELLPLSPLTLWYDPASDGWKSLAIPGADVSLADWARSDPAAWEWVAPETLLGIAGPAQRHAIGAALHSAIAGDLFPPLLARHERFQRLLRGHVGLPPLLDSLIASSMPASFDEERRLLHDVVIAHLSAAGVRPDSERSDALLQTLSETISVRRLAARWEHESHADVALHLLNEYARTAPAEDVPWDAIARLLEARGDRAGALEIATHALQHGGSKAVLTFLSLLRRSETPAGAATEPLRAAVQQLIAAEPTAEVALLTAHVQARYLDDRESARTILQRRLDSSWDEVVRAVMLARLCAENEEYELVSRIAKEARGIIAALPFRGGASGRYADAYLSLLNGIANFGAVAKYQNPSFLSDSYRAFIDALETSIGDGANDVVAAAVQWLHWICAFAELVPAPAFTTIRAGIHAYFQARGLEFARDAAALPPRVPWYDEEPFFAARG